MRLAARAGWRALRGVGLGSCGVISIGAVPTCRAHQSSIAVASATAPRAVAYKLAAHEYEVDIAVIGGGSGGLALAREAAELSARVTLFDFVEPSPQGTKWGIGGTCVNVGCIPKKLMHTAALLGQGIVDSAEYGWRIPTGITHDWKTLSGSVGSYIKSTNFGYRTALRQEKVEYVNALARVTGPHSIAFVDPKTKEEKIITAAHIVVAVGGRPRYPEGVVGAQEHGITSDDLFWQKKPPGRTLLVGASYVALECAGFLTHLGYPTTVMVRGPVLRGFDQQIAEKIVEGMSSTGTRFLRGSQPQKLERLSGSEGEASGIKVSWRTGLEDHSEIFDTVVFATGRGPLTSRLGLREAGVILDSTGKVVGGGPHAEAVASDSPAGRGIWSETSSVPSIHAIGDVLSGRPELTPVAIRAGKLLAHRIVGGQFDEAPAAASDKAAKLANLTTLRNVMDYSTVPTTVFTPIEYGCVGMTEEQAFAALGKDGVDVYHTQYDTLELSVAHRNDAEGLPLPPQCFSKIIVTRGEAPEEERILGIHVLGPHAGEVVQGFAVALRLGATRADLLATSAIHPTHAEEVINIKHTKRAGGTAFIKTSC